MSRLLIAVLVLSCPLANAQVAEPATVEPAQLAALDPPPLLIDIRDADDYAQEHIPGAISIPRAWLEFDLEELPQFDGKEPAARYAHPMVLYCARGFRSAAAAQALRQLGYTQVRSVAGGFEAWKALTPGGESEPAQP